MAARQRLVDDLLYLGTRLSWRVCVAAAVGSALVLQSLAHILIAPTQLGGLSGFGGLVSRNLVGTIFRLLGFAIPLALLFAALVSAIRRSQAESLHRGAAMGGIDAIRQLSWARFERLIGEAFRRQGYEVQETGRRSPDGGIDLVLARNGGEYLVQCKQWRTSTVGVTIIRELNGVMAARHADGGFVVTSGSFTPDARAFAATCPIELIDGARLVSLIGQAQTPSVPQRASSSNSREPSVSCPKCGSAMVRRVAKKGSYAGKEFLGCTRYPTCRGTSEIHRAG